MNKSMITTDDDSSNNAGNKKISPNSR